MKQELLWTLPFAGFACYFLGFPFMRRHTPSEIKKRPELKGKDIETVKKACDKFKVLPTTVMIFAEGTRFSEQKREQMQSPYRHLLKAKGAGAAIVLSELEQELAGIINVTVDYSTEQIGMWKLLCGDFKQLTLRYELLPINSELIGDFYQDRQYRKRFTAWLNELWAAKDQQLEELRDGSNPTPSDTAKPNGDVAS